MSRKIKVLVVDDHKIVREGICNILSKDEEFEVIGAAQDGRSALHMARTLMPDVVMMDIAMPDMNGIEATRRIVSENPRVKVIALSIHSDPRYVAEILKAGASGYLLKGGDADDIIRSIKTVLSGKIFFSDPIHDIIIQQQIRHSDLIDSSVYGVLNKKEVNVLRLLTEGKTTKQIAAVLNISVKTVESYRSQIMKKLNLFSIAELTKYAVREGLTTL